MNSSHFRAAGRRFGGAAAAVSAAALLLALGACSKQQDNATVGQQIDSAVAKTEQAAEKAKDEAQSSMAAAGSAVKDAAQDAKATTQETVDKMSATIDDATITAAVTAGLAKDPDLSAIKINVDTQGGRVSLTGPAPSAEARERASVIAKSIKGVQAVDNQLTIKAG
ncbi:BON domain-containing protein [Variovorax terrae]|uniref:BON domain-containing protein n=1 Tax=Variovorax terrae TaxID=2923278 RepID=A0A9X1VY78_9BURK|nr:BON domain-containing protein [Variovorax terrae]MCJ0765120.1 BON domain-containing protein [Variovorax terrae]